MPQYGTGFLTLLHSERPKLHTNLAFLSAVGLMHVQTAYVSAQSGQSCCCSHKMYKPSGNQQVQNEVCTWTAGSMDSQTVFVFTEYHISWVLKQSVFFLLP